jgi:hypothetical protein
MAKRVQCTDYEVLYSALYARHASDSRFAWDSFEQNAQDQGFAQGSSDWYRSMYFDAIGEGWE